MQIFKTSMKNKILTQKQKVPGKKLLFAKTANFIGKVFLILPVLVYGFENGTAITEDLPLHFESFCRVCPKIHLDSVTVKNLNYHLKFLY